MSITRPLEDALRNLISELYGHWKSDKTLDEIEARFIELEHDCYPRTIWRYKDRKVVVAIRRHPEENLEVTLVSDLLHKIELIHEGFYDRFSKKLGLISEYQTGNPDFDRRYFITSNDKSNELLSSSEFQWAVTTAEPFLSLQFSPGGITHNSEIEKPSALNMLNIELILQHLFALERAAKR